MKSNFPKSLTESTPEENLLFHLSSQIDYNVQVIVAKLKCIASQQPSLEQMHSFDTFVSNLSKQITEYYEKITKEDSAESN